VLGLPFNFLGYNKDMEDIKPAKKLSTEEIKEIKKEISGVSQVAENYQSEIKPEENKIGAELKSAFENEAEKMDLKSKLEKIYSWRQEPEIKEEAVAEKKVPWVLFISIIGAVLVLAAAGAYYFLKIKDKPVPTQTAVENTEPVQPEAEAVAEETPPEEAGAETPMVVEKDLKPAEVKILVFNGGAPAGTAGKVKALLVGKGYVKAEAKNAEGDAYAGTLVYYGEGLNKNADAIKEVLKVKYPKVETKAAATAEEKSADIVVILGK